VSEPTPVETVSDDAGVRFRGDITVELVKAAARDADVLFAARVSTRGEQSLEDVDGDAERSRGLINYLMRDRHGCYDDATEVLTGEGWKPWPEVTGREDFATLSPTGRLEYQRAVRRVRRRYRGPMLAVRTRDVDLLVTPDHHMWASRRRRSGPQEWALTPARELLQAPHRLALGGGVWQPEAALGFPPAFFALLGLFVANGHVAPGTVTPIFRLRQAGQIRFLRERAARAGYDVASAADRQVLRADEDFGLLAKKCYDVDGVKVIPTEVLRGATTEGLRALLEGLFEGLAGSNAAPSAPGQRIHVTTSRALAGQLQEVALKTGQAAVVAPRPRRTGESDYRVTFHPARQARPRIGWTVADRARDVTPREYAGWVHCVTVPHGTLYVRRNGVPVWSGNSPFEHTSMTFYVQAPIFVFRELMRHRMASYNEESGRYRELRPVFYVPGRDRRLVQEGKPGRYVFVAGSPEQHALVEEETRRVCREAYAAYQRMLHAGVAREVARIVLPLTIYSSMYVTMNARALMNFLSLRTAREDSRFPSFPQREIEMVAERMEAEWIRLMPVTAAAFDANGRVAP
jgi:flavin-dependent thymidylate synthase